VNHFRPGSILSSFELGRPWLIRVDLVEVNVGVVVELGEAMDSFALHQVRVLCYHCGGRLGKIVGLGEEGAGDRGGLNVCGFDDVLKKRKLRLCKPHCGEVHGEICKDVNSLSCNSKLVTVSLSRL